MKNINIDMFKSLAISENISEEILKSSWFKEIGLKLKYNQIDALR
jgi:hypothetical protein